MSTMFKETTFKFDLNVKIPLLDRKSDQYAIGKKYFKIEFKSYPNIFSQF